MEMEINDNEAICDGCRMVVNRFVLTGRGKCPDCAGLVLAVIDRE
jgi:hypothetical protein